MAKKNETSTVEHGTKHSAQEIKEFTQKQQMLKDFAKNAKDTLQLLDLQNPTTKSYTVYSKENLRTYLKNPLSESNQQNLRKLSQFLYHLSFQLRRIISYYASQVDLSCYNVVPNVSMTEKNDQKKILQNYEEVLHWLARMNMAKQIYDLLIIAWREDAVFTYCYWDDKAENDVNSFVMLPMDGNYCKISSVNYDSTFNYAFDFSFFSGSNEAYLEYWDKEFTKKYEAYKKDTKLRWQELDPQRAVCFKINSDQHDRIIPPLASLYEDIIDLIDLRGISNIKDALSIYKLLVAQIETIDGSNEPDDFSIDLDTAVEFYNKMCEALPPEVGMVLSPMKIEPIEFEKHASDDTDEISEAMSNLWESAGVSQVLDAKRLTGSTAVKMSTIADALMAIKPVLPQIEAWVNRFLDYVVTDNQMRVEYIDITPFTKEDRIKIVKEAATLGLPVKLQYASLLGLSPLDVYSLCFLENDVLQLDQNFIPLVSTYTIPGKDSPGAPTKDDGDLSDEGANTRDGEKNKN